MEKYKVGVIGGTGMVGQRFVTLMENHPWFELKVIAASPRSAGKTVSNLMKGNRNMKIENIEKKYSSKTYRFFDLLYKLLVINLLIIILSIPVITIFPAIVAATATIKNNITETAIFKPYFKNFKTYFWKSFLMGLFFLFSFAAGIYGYFFWSYQDFGNSEMMEIFAQIGIVVIVICLIVFTFIIVHTPLLLITFNKLNNVQIFKTSMYISVRYFLTTLFMLLATIVIIGVLVLCLFVPWVLGIWMIIGISLPLYLVIKITTPIYYRFAKIDFEKINKKVEEDIKDDK